MDLLLHWAESQGCSFPDIEVRGRQLHAKRDIPSDAALFDIPQHLLLHEGQAWDDQAYGSAFHQLKEEVGDALDKRWTLCLLLLIEQARGKDSKWAQYINVLPQSYEDPLWWSEEDLNILKGTRLGAAVEHYSKGLEDLRAWRARLCTIQRELGGANVLEGESGQWAMSETALKWAKSTVWSRAFNIKALGAARKEGIALIPVLDMLDHNPQQHVAWHTGNTGEENFRFLTKSAITKGDQLYSNYGHKSNEELLLGYGFVLEPNTADYFSVSLGLEASSAAGRERAALLRALLQRLGLQTEFYLTRAFPLPSTLVVAAAACLLPSAQAYSLLATAPPPASGPTADSSDGGPPDNGAKHGESSEVQQQEGMVSGMIEVQPAPLAAAAAPAGGPAVRSGLQLACPVAVHLQALLALKQQLRGKMEKLQGGSFHSDMELAAAAPAGSAAHMALVYRAGQKEIAHAALGELAQQTEALLHAAFTGGSSQATPGSVLGSIPQQDSPSWGALREHLAGTAWHWGLEVLQECQPGQELARLPLAAGVVAASRAGLVLQLALMHIRKGHSALSATAPQDSWPAEAGSSDACHASETAGEACCTKGSALLDRLIQNVEVPFAASLLSGDVGSLSAAEALAGTQLDDLLQEESEQYQEQYAAAAPSMRAALVDINKGAQANGHGMSEAEGGAPGDELCPGLSHGEAIRALAWADAVVDRCGVPGPSGSQLAILPLICALPKVLRSLVVDFSWEETAGEAVLVLSTPVLLKAGLVLSHAALLQDSSFETVLLSWGLSCCSDLLAGAADTSYSFELCIDPPDEHPHAELCRNLLVASGLGGTHFLSLTTSQEPLLAAIAVCCADEDGLNAMGSSDLLRQHAATDTAPSGSESGTTGLGDSAQSPEEESRQQWVAAENFVAAIKGDKHLMKAARRQLKSLLQDARSGLSPSDQSPHECKDNQEILLPVLEYRSSMEKILDYNLSMLQQHSKRPLVADTAAKKQGKSRHK